MVGGSFVRKASGMWQIWVGILGKLLESDGIKERERDTGKEIEDNREMEVQKGKLGSLC